MKTTNREKFTDKLTVILTFKTTGDYFTYHFDTKRKALAFYNLKKREYSDADGKAFLNWKIELL